MTAVEIKITSISNLVKNTDYNTKTTEIEKKLTDDYITTPKFNKLAVYVFNARITQVNLRKKKQILIPNYPTLIEKLLLVTQKIFSWKILF